MNKTLKIGLLISAAATLAACQDQAPEQNADGLTELTLILDYVPNTNHTGIYWALDQGYYEDQGIDLTIIEPGEDTTALTAVAADNAQIGVSYQEDVTYTHANQPDMDIRAIATIMEENTSGFVSRADSGIETPADFPGQVYAGWQSPSEEAIVEAVMEDYGADFDELTMVGDTGEGPEGLGSSYDIQWYFEAWDNVKADQAGIPINYMPLREMDERLNYYTPILVTTDRFIESSGDVLQSFMDATKQGYQEVIRDPEAAGDFMAGQLPEYDAEFIQESQLIASDLYTSNPDAWGLMEESVWDGYTDFMVEAGLIDEAIPAANMYTNQFLEAE